MLLKLNARAVLISASLLATVHLGPKEPMIRSFSIPKTKHLTGKMETFAELP